jgi:peptidoglycan hydrolase CwlO-like protein
MADQTTDQATVVDGLSILSQLELEATQIAASRRGLAQVRKVIEAYQVANKTLAELDHRKDDLQAQVDSLQSRYDSELSTFNAMSNGKKDEIARVIAEGQSRIDAVNAQISEVEKTLVEKQDDSARKIKALDQDIRSKTQERQALTDSFEKFRRDHGLVSQ